MEISQLQPLKDQQGLIRSYSHLRVNLRYDADAVVVRDGEVVIKHPAGRVGPRPAAVVRRERVEVSHVPVCEQQIVPRAVNVMSNLKIKRTADLKLIMYSHHSAINLNLKLSAETEIKLLSFGFVN